MKNILTIAGSDSCGGAGIQADLKTMSALGVYGMSVITAITAQNSMGVHAVQEVSEEMIRQQLEAIFDDIEVDAIKIGMLSSSTVIKTILSTLKKYSCKNIVIDTVMLSKNRYKLLQDEGMEALKKLIALGTVVTPNIPEAEVLANMKIKNENDMIEAGKKIQSLGAKNILIKGGHREDDCTDVLLLESGEVLKFPEVRISTKHTHGTGQSLGAKNILIKGGHREDDCTDVLLLESGEVLKFPEVRISTKHTHGTGCTLSSAIASFIGKGYSVEESVKFSKEYITEAIRNSFPLGKGVGPLGHLIDLYKKANIEY